MIHDYERKENHWLFLARIVNNKTRNTEAAAFVRLGAGKVLRKMSAVECLWGVDQ